MIDQPDRDGRDHSYVYNRQSRVLHRIPGSEACNTDQIKNRKKFATENEAATKLGHGFIRCSRCFPYA